MREYVVGFILGMVFVWLYHHFISPLPGGKTGG